MLNLILGRAGSGKTTRAINKIKSLADREVRSILIVPEQYSHDAERQLSLICGDSISLHAEVLSFSRLCSRIFADTGKLGLRQLDGGGRVLLMRLALDSVMPRLKVYNSAGTRAEFLSGLIATYDQFRGARTDFLELGDLLEEKEGKLKDKITDLLLIFAAYEAVIPHNQMDPRGKLELLSEEIEKSAFLTGKHIYIDGFTDFTAQETAVVEKMIKNHMPVTLCLTCPSLDDEEPEFYLPRRTANRLLRFASERNVPSETEVCQGDSKSRPPELMHLDMNMFGDNTGEYEGGCSAIGLSRGGSVTEECELAAAKIIELVRDGGYRYRDIAVAAAGWDRYEAVAENIFTKYGIPVFTAEKSDILEKPVMLMITAAIDIIVNNWDYVSIFRYLKTNLTGISMAERDIMENYVVRWNIRGRSMWARETGWIFNPVGFSAELTEAEEAALERINALRRQIMEPLSVFEKEIRAAAAVREKIIALYGFMERVHLPGKLEEKAAELRESGRGQTADEYIQLWDILVSAMEQFASVMGDKAVSTEDFAAMFKLLLSQYDVGTIPAALDRVGLGDISRMKRRDIKCLIVMGASDDAMPDMRPGGGLISEEEQEELGQMGIDLGDSAEIRVARALGAVYSSLTLPSERLFMSYAATGDSDRPSFVMSRISEMFGLDVEAADDAVRLNALLPAFELAAAGNEEAAEYFAALPEWKVRLEAVKNAVKMPKEHLSKNIAERLYGRSIATTATRAERFSACRFAYFMQYGLRAREKTEAAFDAPEMGTFMHFVLENVTREAMEAGGFKCLDEQDFKRLTRKHVTRYISDVLGGFQDKSGRFRYLFGRLTGDVEHIVLDMAEELKNSDFVPLDFELSFAPGGDMPPAEIEDGEARVTVSGKVDRVDGWEKDGKLYLRVVDYKTGRKAFSLSDVWYGMNMQMLIYLFALENNGKRRYGKDIVPAGVLYTPARNVILPAERDATEAEIEKERRKNLVRSGLILSDGDVLEAMEHGPERKFIPVKVKKDGTLSGGSLAGAEKFCSLSWHINAHLLEMAKEMREGEISADPYFKSDADNACLYCEFYGACHFEERDDGAGRRFVRKLKPDEAWVMMEGGKNE